MKKIKLFCIALFILLQSGCGATESVVSNNDFKELSFQPKEALAEAFKLSECTTAEAEINVGAFCVYGEDMVYEVNYNDSLTDQTGLKGNVPFEAKYNTELRRLNMATGKDELLYKYDADGCVDITNIIFNESYLVWETMEDTWKLHLLRLEQDNAVETIVDGTQSAGDLSEVILSLKGEEVFWYNQNGAAANCITLYHYDIPEGEVHPYKSQLDLRSPYTKPAILDKTCTVFSMEQNGTNHISVIDMHEDREMLV